MLNTNIVVSSIGFLTIFVIDRKLCFSKKINHKLVCMFLIKRVFLLFFIFPFCVVARDWKTEILRFGVAKDFPPYEYTNAQGESVGSDIDFIHALSQELGFSYKIIRGEWSELNNLLQQDKIDVFASAAKTPQREKKFVFSDPYQSYSFVFAMYKNAGIGSLEEINHQDVLMYQNVLNQEFVQKLPIQFTSVYTKTELEALELMLTRKYKVIFVNNAFLYGELSRRHLENEIEVFSAGLPSISLCLMAKKKNEKLIDFLNEGFYTLKITGKYEAINERWFPKMNNKKWDHSLFVILFVICIFIAVLLILIFVLRRRTLIVNRKHQVRMRNIRQLIENFPISLMMIQLEKDNQSDFSYRDIVFCNKQLKQTFGDISVSGLAPLISEKSKDDFLNFTRYVLRTRKNTMQQMTLQLKTGIKIEAQLQAETFEVEKHLYLLGVAMDISELLKAREQAKKDNVRKMNFLSTISHEIRTPLNAIVGFSQLLTEIEDITLRDQYNQIIKKNNKELIALMNDVLLLSKLEAKSLQVENQHIDLVPIMYQKKLDYLREIEHKSEVNLVVYHPYSSLNVLIDLNRFIIILDCLVSNAIKYTEKGNIEVGYYVHNDELVCFCQDTGKGIAEDLQVCIFNRFEKLDTFQRGTGLGLTIVRTIIEQRKGKLGLYSVLNKGTLIWASVKLPVEYAFSEQSDDARIRQILSHRIDGFWFDYTGEEVKFYGIKNRKEGLC